MVGAFLFWIASILIPLVFVVWIIVLIYKRFKDKEKEDFEKRDY